MTKGRMMPDDPFVSQEAGSFKGNSSKSMVNFLVEGAVDHVHAIDAVMRTIQGQTGTEHNNADTVPNNRFYYNAKGDPCRLTDINYSRWGQISEVSWEEVYSANENFGNQANHAGDGTGIFGDPNGHYRIKVAFDSSRPVTPKMDWQVGVKGLTVYNSESTAGEYDDTGASVTPEYNTQIGVERDTMKRTVKGATRQFPDPKFNIRWEMRIPQCAQQDALTVNEADGRPLNEIPFWWTINNPNLGYYSESCRTLTGCVNAGRFCGYQKGQILYLGCSFRCVDPFFDWWEVTHQFDYAPNKYNLNLGDYAVSNSNLPEIETGIKGVEGHQYVWTTRGTKPGPNNMFNPAIRTCTIENIYPHDDLNCLFRKIVGSRSGMDNLPTSEGTATLRADNPFKYGDPIVTRSPLLEWGVDGTFPAIVTS